MVVPLADRRRLHRGANDALDRNLAPDEAGEVVIKGPSNQAIVGTSRRAFVYKRGFMAGASFGSELTSWDYRHLVGVQLHTGMLSGAVVLQAPGQTGNRTNTWKFGDDDPYKAPNAIPITKPWQQAEEGVARLRQLIDRAHQPSGGPCTLRRGPTRTRSPYCGSSASSATPACSTRRSSRPRRRRSCDGYSTSPVCLRR